MKTKLNFKWKKGWETVDKARGGYAETSYEFFEHVSDIPLLKSKAADVWYIGNLQKGELPNPERLFYDEKIARGEFETVKRFVESELASRHRFERMSKNELRNWIDEYGHNKYIGESLYLYAANSASQRASNKD